MASQKENIEQMRSRHEKEISQLQKLCNHKKHHKARFMWAIGHFAGDVEVCDFCWKILKHYHDEPFSKSQEQELHPIKETVINKFLKERKVNG